MKLPIFSAARLSRGRLLRLIIDHNPFYLLSALCMLGGLLTLTNSSSYSPVLGALFSLMRGSNADEEQRAEAVPGKA